MSATVYIPTNMSDDFVERLVPEANHATETSEGYLRLKSSESWGAVDCGLFKRWDHVVIHPRYVRGTDGRFAKKDT